MGRRSKDKDLSEVLKRRLDAAGPVEGDLTVELAVAIGRDEVERLDQAIREQQRD